MASQSKSEGEDQSGSINPGVSIASLEEKPLGWTDLAVDVGTQSYAQLCTLSPSAPGSFVSDRLLSLVISSGVYTTNKAATYAITWTYNAVQVKTYGTPTEMWGYALTPAIINSSGFGFRRAISDDDAVDGSTLLLTGLGFSIPTGSTILGVEVIEDHFNWPSSGVTPGAAGIDNITMKVYYNPPLGGGVWGPVETATRKKKRPTFDQIVKRAQK